MEAVIVFALTFISSLALFTHCTLNSIKDILIEIRNAIEDAVYAPESEEAATEDDLESGPEQATPYGLI